MIFEAQVKNHFLQRLRFDLPFWIQHPRHGEVLGHAQKRHETATLQDIAEVLASDLRKAARTFPEDFDLLTVPRRQLELFRRVRRKNQSEQIEQRRFPAPALTNDCGEGSPWDIKFGDKQREGSASFGALDSYLFQPINRCHGALIVCCEANGNALTVTEVARAELPPLCRPRRRRC